jgi:hypothetical protein
MVTLQGLPNFFAYMNGHYAHWVLVGGCAAWMHIARAEREMSEDVEVYRRIFPDDIDVVIVGDQIEEVEVQVGTLGPLKVQFTRDADATTEELSRTADSICGARVLPMQLIINKYQVATSTKAAVRLTRVFMLKQILARQRISPALAMQQFTAPPQLSMIGSAAAAMQARLAAKYAADKK